jgi:ascorbate-specific PTS system EIIC-type component UlaA
MSNIGAFEAVDVSHPFLLTFALAHILLFFLQGAISHMVTLFLAIKASERDLDRILTLLLVLELVDLFFLFEFATSP